MKLRIKFKLLSPVSHIGETASTGSYFQTILTDEGRIPVLTGNSTRGHLRDNMALHLLQRLGTKVDKEIFHLLFSGGNISAAMKDDIAKAKQVREHFPSVSLLGGGLGTMIMAGKLLVSYGYPICDETSRFTGIEKTGLSWHSLIDEIEFTRTDDSKNDIKAALIRDIDSEKIGKASTQMRYSVQYLAAGTEIVQDFIFLPSVTALELGAFFAGMAKWFETPRIGGMASKGFGIFDAILGDGAMILTHGKIDIRPDVIALIKAYEAHIDAEGTQFFDLLKEGKAGGKKGNVSAEDNSSSD